jgi:Transcription factor S-II (TFIIS)
MECGHEEMEYTTMQLRSADEGQTVSSLSCDTRLDTLQKCVYMADSAIMYLAGILRVSQLRVRALQKGALCMLLVTAQCPACLLCSLSCCCCGSRNKWRTVSAIAALKALHGFSFKLAHAGKQQPMPQDSFRISRAEQLMGIRKSCGLVVTKPGWSASPCPAGAANGHGCGSALHVVLVQIIRF